MAQDTPGSVVEATARAAAAQQAAEAAMLAVGELKLELEKVRRAGLAVEARVKQLERRLSTIENGG